MAIIGDLSGLGSLAELAKTLVTTIFPDKTAEEQANIQAQLTLGLAQTDLVKQQIVTNQEEAKNSSWFVAGGRASLWWVFSTSLAWTYAIGPIFSWVATTFGGHPPTIPGMDSNILFLLGSMLGIDTTNMVAKHVVNNVLSK